MKPRVVAWETTRACPLACIHCRAEAQHVADPRQLTTAEGRALLSDIAGMTGGGPTIVILTGGEPLTRPDIFDLAAHGSSLGLYMAVSPDDGRLLTPETCARLKESGIRQLSFSLHYPDSAENDYFARTPGAFDAAKQGLANLRAVGLPYQINTTVTRRNADRLPAMYELVASLEPVCWDLFFLVPTGRASGLADAEMPPARYEATLNWLLDLQRTASLPIKQTCAPHFRRIERQRGREVDRPGGSGEPGLPRAPHGVRLLTPAQRDLARLHVRERLRLRLPRRRRSGLRLPARDRRERSGAAVRRGVHDLGGVRRASRSHAPRREVRPLRVQTGLWRLPSASLLRVGRLSGRGALLHLRADGARERRLTQPLCRPEPCRVSVDRPSLMATRPTAPPALAGRGRRRMWQGGNGPMTTLDRVALFTNEYPPRIYGGAGVHVEYLSRALAKLVPVEVRCFGDQHIWGPRFRVRGYPGWPEAGEDTDPRFKGALDAFHRDLAMAKDRLDASLVHSHTWYTAMAGFVAKQLWDVPLVVTVHSLEPLRPWKAEQLGNGYHLSSWMERTALESADAVIAVSKETREDVLRHFDISPERIHVIHNGIDLDEYRPAAGTHGIERHGIDPSQPYVLFVGRITRQKGIFHLLDAVPQIDPRLQVVFDSSTADTPEIRRQMAERVAEVSARREGVFWIQEMVPREELIQLYSHAAVFCCPSVYEPFGIINLEAMACETAVVASKVGGIPEVVVDGETGLLVDPHLKPGTWEPENPEEYARDLARAIDRVALDPELQARFGRNGRRRVEDHFSWHAIALQTLDLYRSLVTDSAAQRLAA